jgi:hypothetical protein
MELAGCVKECLRLAIEPTSILASITEFKMKKPGDENLPSLNLGIFQIAGSMATKQGYNSNLLKVIRYHQRSSINLLRK